MCSRGSNSANSNYSILCYCSSALRRLMSVQDRSPSAGSEREGKRGADKGRKERGGGRRSWSHSPIHKSRKHRSRSRDRLSSSSKHRCVTVVCRISNRWLPLARVSKPPGARVFGYSRSRYFGPAPAPDHP